MRSNRVRDMDGIQTSRRAKRLIRSTLPGWHL